MILIASLIGIALFDSLNPSLFVAQFYLFTMPQPTPRIVSYIFGILAANYGGGVLLLTGFGTLLSGLLAQIPPVWSAGLQLGGGLALLVFGLWYKAAPQSEPEMTHKPRSAGLLAAFAFGVFVMGQELTTALPYFVAIERIADAQLSVLNNLLALGLYNLIFALPLFAFLGLFVRFRQRFTAQLDRISAWMRVWMPRIVKYAALIVGVLLIVSGAGFFLSG
jgi:cytochrome c biogenesis protein CcdA